MFGSATKTMRAAVAVALVAALAIPLPALAFERTAPVIEPAPAGEPGLYGERTGMQVQTALRPETREMVRRRIRDRIAAWREHFESMARAIMARITRLETIADRVEQAGGDVDEARELLDEARDLVAEARKKAVEAGELFRQVPDADDPREAFEKAVEKAIEAIHTLRDARAKVRAAAEALRKAVMEIRNEA